MHRRHLLLATAGTWAATAATRTARAQGSATAAVELAGVRYAPTANLGGATLSLNGAGIRYRFVVRVYTAGLYLATKATTTEAVLSAAGPKRLHVVMLRDIDGNDLGKLFTRGMQDNSPREEFAKSIPGTLRMAEVFATKKRLAQGESFGFDWLPGQGTVLMLNGKPFGEPIKEPEFFHALMRIWLGPSPADANLKDALLGLPPKAQPQQ
jgi:hypothetical protein